MYVKELKSILNNLPDDTSILIQHNLEPTMREVQKTYIGNLFGDRIYINDDNNKNIPQLKYLILSVIK